MTDHDGGRLRFTAKSGKAEPMTIQPALTAEEWKGQKVEQHHNTIAFLDARDGGLVVVSDGATPCDRPSALMALANAALPDDDPRKLVAADVKALRGLLEDGYREDPDWGSNAELVDRLAAKLGALLPPDV